jgi:DNA-binding YbaB/EbfC family protein
MGMNRDMMARLQQMQQQAMKAQQELEEKVVEGTAGGGAVSVSLTGGMTVQALKIAPEVVDPDDVEMLEDLITAAVNEALQQVQQLQMQQISGIAGQLGLGGLGR